MSKNNKIKQQVDAKRMAYRLINNLCLLCSKNRDNKTKTCSVCLSKRQARFDVFLAKGLCPFCAAHNPVEHGKKRCNECLNKFKIFHANKTKEYKENRNKAVRNRASYIRADVLKSFGSCCSFCKINDFDVLNIDHINNNGAQERRELIGSHIYEKLYREELNRTHYQILCSNCNVKKTYKFPLHKITLPEIHEYYKKLANEEQDKRKNQNLRNRVSKYKIKLEVFNHYSNSCCVSCGENDFRCLSLDHINNDGFLCEVSGEKLYRKLRLEKFPQGYQVLCFNCNYKKYRQVKVCP